MAQAYLKNVIRIFKQYRLLAEDTFAQMPKESLTWQYNEASNSIAMIIHHMSGNMLSRWTDFLSTDGEKEWRNRDKEFEAYYPDRAQLMDAWNQGWDCFLTTMESLTPDDLGKMIKIRNEPHNVMEAINRQLAHYSYHVGQIVFLGKMVASGNWQSLSIPKGDSEKFNREKFAEEQMKEQSLASQKNKNV